MNTENRLREHISCFADDMLRTIDRELAIAALDSVAGQRTLLAYRLIGDVLRAQPGPEFSEQFAVKLASVLDGEPARRVGAEEHRRHRCRRGLLRTGSNN